MLCCDYILNMEGFKAVVAKIWMFKPEDHWSFNSPETICSEQVYGNNFKDWNSLGMVGGKAVEIISWSIYMEVIRLNWDSNLQPLGLQSEVLPTTLTVLHLN